MPLKTKRWDDEIDEDDGFRLLICRYRPRGLKKEFESWAEWWPELGPSSMLHAGAYGKGGVKIGWEIYERRFRAEMKRPQSQERIQELSQRVKAGETITLLCSTACVKQSRCHRSIIAALVEETLAAIRSTNSL